jgi:hypothetical protein
MRQHALKEDEAIFLDSLPQSTLLQVAVLVRDARSQIRGY